MPVNKIIPKLTGGAIIANIVPFIALPFMLNEFTVSEFGEVTIFFSFVLILSQTVTLKFDQAILVAQSIYEVRRLLGLSIYLSSIITVSLTIIFIIINSVMAITSISLILLTSASIMINTFIICQQNIANYKLSTFQMNLFFLTPIVTYPIIALIIGSSTRSIINPLILSKILSLLITLIIILFISKVCFSKGTISELKKIAITYASYPKAILPSKLLNLFSVNGINFLIPLLFSTTELGYFNISRTILKIPEAVISRPLENFLRRSSYKDSKLDILKFKKEYSKYFKYILALSAAGLFIYYFIYFFGFEWLINVFPDWEKTFIISNILVWTYLISTIITPFMSSFRILKEEKLELYFQLSLLAALAIFFLISISLKQSFVDSVMTFTLVRIISYLYCGKLILETIKKN